MSPIVNVIGVAVGVYLIYTVVKTMRMKKMSAAHSLLWILAGIFTIILSIFPSLLQLAADFFGISWQPSVILFTAIVIIVFIVFNHTKDISVMRAQLTELSEQVSVLKYELQTQDILKKEKREE